MNIWSIGCCSEIELFYRGCKEWWEVVLIDMCYLLVVFLEYRVLLMWFVFLFVGKNNV